MFCSKNLKYKGMIRDRVTHRTKETLKRLLVKPNGLGRKDW